MYIIFNPNCNMCRQGRCGMEWSMLCLPGYLNSLINCKVHGFDISRHQLSTSPGSQVADWCSPRCFRPGSHWTPLVFSSKSSKHSYWYGLLRSVRRNTLKLAWYESYHLIAEWMLLQSYCRRHDALRLILAWRKLWWFVKHQWRSKHICTKFCW